MPSSPVHSNTNRMTSIQRFATQTHNDEGLREKDAIKINTHLANIREID